MDWIARIRRLPRVVDDDGKIATLPSKAVEDRAIEFVQSLSLYYRSVLDPENGITASPRGTIVLDWYFRKSFVSVEVDEANVGFYSELPDGSSPSAINNHKLLVSSLYRVFGRSPE